MYQPPNDPNQQLPYPPLQPSYGQTPPIPKTPKKKEISARRAIFLYVSILVGACVLLIVGANLMYGRNGQASTNNYQYQWESTYTFTGSGDKKTEAFTPHGPGWRLAWSCVPSSFYGDSYNLIVHVVNVSDNTIADFALNTICKPGNTQDETTEHVGGTFYLDVLSEGDWTLKVMELV